jgi:hypothetical protein
MRVVAMTTNGMEVSEKPKGQNSMEFLVRNVLALDLFEISMPFVFLTTGIGAWVFFISSWSIALSVLRSSSSPNGSGTMSGMAADCRVCRCPSIPRLAVLLTVAFVNCSDVGNPS